MIAGVVLAAGSSRRLGRPKQLVEIGGRPALRWVVDAALASSLDRVVVVLGHEAERIGSVLPADPRLEVVRNPDHAEGQSTSLVAGLDAIGEADAAVILLGDQPEVAAGSIDAVVAAWRSTGAPVVQASYRDRAGHPVLLAKAAWPELRAVTGDVGARGVLGTDPARLVLVTVDREAPGDLDTEHDVASMRARFEP